MTPEAKKKENGAKQPPATAKPVEAAAKGPKPATKKAAKKAAPAKKAAAKSAATNRLDQDAVIKIVVKDFDPASFSRDSATRAKYLSGGGKTVGQFATWCKKQDADAGKEPSQQRNGLGFLRQLIEKGVLSLVTK